MSKKNRIKCICNYCSKEFELPASRVLIGRGKHCSRKCYAQDMSKVNKDSHRSWKGGRFERNGYIFIHKPDHPHANSTGYVREHRLVIEDKLGRILDPKEVVHHINKDKTDNRIENLELLKSSSDHAKRHSMSEENKRIISDKMKKYWADKKKNNYRTSDELRNRLSDLKKEWWSNKCLM